MKIKNLKDKLTLFLSLLMGAILTAPFELFIAGLHWKPVLVLRILTIFLNGIVAFIYSWARNIMRKTVFRYGWSPYIKELTSFFMVFSLAYIFKLLIVIILNRVNSDIFPLSLENIVVAITGMVIGTFLWASLYRPLLAKFYIYRRKKKF